VFIEANKNMSEKVLDIPKLPDELRIAAASEELVIFFGNGVSRLVNLPSWHEFAFERLKELFDNGIIHFFEFENLKSLPPRQLLSICNNIIIEAGSHFKAKSTKDVLMNKYDPDYSSVYEDLLKLDVIYVTTNYDDLLYGAALSLTENIGDTKVALTYGSEKQKSLFTRYYKIDDITEDHLKKRNILHLHGCVENEESLIITIYDYFKHYGYECVSSFLKSLFQDKIVLFIGYGLEEFEILEYIVKKAEIAKINKQHYILMPFFKQEEIVKDHISNYYEQLGLFVIPYAKDIKGYNQLSNIISFWVNENKSFLDKMKIVDEVL
jgi:hypothetical protein